MIAAVLLRPKRPLPRRFNRRVSPAMQSFAKRRHRRSSGGYRERWKKTGRRIANMWEVWQTRLRHWLLSIVGGLVLAVMGVALFSPILQVREIRVQRGEGRVDVARIQQALAPLFGKHMLFVSARDVTARVRDVVPDLQSVSLEKQYPSLLFVRITLKPIIARLILEEPLNKAAQSGAILSTASGDALHAALPVRQYDYLTENGMYVVTSSAMADSKLPAIKIRDWGVRPLPATLLLAPDMLMRMQQTEQTLASQFGLHITARSVYVRAQEFHLATNAFSLWFDLHSTLQEQIGRYKVFLQAVGLKDIHQYVDLRLAGRVVYR